MRLGIFGNVAAVLLLVAFGASSATAAPSTVPDTAPQMVGVPSFIASYHTTPPYVLVNPCSPGEAAIVFRILVRNAGTGASAAINDYHAVWIQDVANPSWSGGMTLPAIKAGDSPAVDVPLVALKDTDKMQGHHNFKVTFEQFGGNTLQIPVDFPPAFCKPVTSVAPYSVATAPPHGQENSKYAQMQPPIPNPNLKTVVFGADVLGSMVADVYVWTDKSVVDNDYYNKDGPFVRDLLTLQIGHTHNASLFRDQAHTQVSQYTNSIFRGYAHFPVTGIAGHTVTNAKLRLNGNPTYGTTCIAQYGGADHVWNPGDKLFIAGTAISGPIVGQDLTLDVTSIVQSWAKSSNPVTAFAFTDGVPFAIYNIVAISDSCMTSFNQAVLDVTYL
ncbi:MAG: hypothetical protein JO194_10665 [Candidatus Eremiobacteraeota bacterium]|nr:hypothetical protein [Candidatus Eremiobacteraeota bacterium]